MSKPIIVITRADGGVSIMYVLNAKVAEADLVKEWKTQHPGEYVSHRSSTDAELPRDRTNRNLWRDVGGRVTKA